MKTKNEMSRGSERIPYEIPSTIVCEIAFPKAILAVSPEEGNPTEAEDGGNDC